jgi:hypothetical protein
MVSDHSYLSTKIVVESSTGQAIAPVAKTSQGPIPPSFWISNRKGKTKTYQSKGVLRIFSKKKIRLLFSNNLKMVTLLGKFYRQCIG